jgi:hypothetical protein
MFIAVLYRELAKACQEATEKLWEKARPALVPMEAATQAVLWTDPVA